MQRAPMPGRVSSVLIAAAGLAAAALAAQGSRPADGLACGRVVDCLLEPVVGARIEVVRAADEVVVRTSQSDGSGFFALSGLPLDEELVVRASAAARTIAATTLSLSPRAREAQGLLL